MPGQLPRLPAGDADRARLLALLREHYARGHLDDAGLDQRLGIVLSAEFTEEADAAVAGLPSLAGPTASGPGPGPPPLGPLRPRQRGHAHAAKAAAGWVPTAERFRDPTSRVIMRVWVDPADGSRHYVPDGQS